MNAAQGTAAAIPIAIALAGGGLMPSADDGRQVRSRVAVTAQNEVNIASLNVEQHAWLAEHNPFGLPKTDQPGTWTVLVREGHTLAHNNVDLIADWVSLHLTKEYADGPEDRPGSSHFKPDPLLPAGRRAERKDYKGFQGVYDRGHQAANGDSKGRGLRVIRESFLLSNMTPQNSRLNQNKWRVLEMKIQDLARSEGELWIITGPVFLDDDNDGLVDYFVIGENQVAVPTHYYKIVFTRSKTEPGKIDGAWAFLIPNIDITSDFSRYEDYLVSIDDIEKVTGYDFLSGLEDVQEEAVEKPIAVTLWDGA